MKYTPIFFAWFATALVAASPTPQDADTVANRATDISEETMSEADAMASYLDTAIAPPAPLTPLEFSTSATLPDNISDHVLASLSLLTATSNTPGVLLPDLQSTTPGHTWPLIQCDPSATHDKHHKLGKHFSCESGRLPAPIPSNISIFTWDTDKIKVGNRCHQKDNAHLPPTWVCMKTSKKRFAKHRLQRGFGKKIDCRTHPEVEHCGEVITKKEIVVFVLLHWPTFLIDHGRVMEVVDEEGREWDRVGGW